MRRRGAVDQLDQRNGRTDHDAAEQAGAEHAEEGRHRDEELGPIAAPQLLQRRQLEQAGYRHQDDRGEDRLGKAVQELREEEHDDENDQSRDRAGEGRPGAAAFVDERLRHSAADREAAPQSRGEIGDGEREEFLIGVEATAVLGRKGSADGGGLDGAEQEAGEGEGQEVVQVGPADRGKADRREALGHLAEELHPAGFEIEQGRHHDGADNHEQGHRLVLEVDLAEDQEEQRDPADGERRDVGLTEMGQELPAVLPEVAMRAMDAEQFRQLGAGEEEGHSALEPDHDAFGDEVHDRAGADQPGDERDQRRQQCGGRGERAEPGRVAAGQFAERGSDEERNGRRDGNRRVARTAKEPEDQTGEEACIEACLGRQIGERGVAEPGGEHIRRQRDAGDHVPPQPRPLIRPQPLQRGQHAGRTEPTGLALVHATGPAENSSSLARSTAKNAGEAAPAH